MLTQPDIDGVQKKGFSHIYVQSEMRALGVGIDRIHGDRILHEALAVNPDPLHLSLVFNLS